MAITSNYRHPDAPPQRNAPIYKNLTFQVLTAILIGALIGGIRPDWGVALKPVADGFIRLVKLVVGPIIFLTIVNGIASMGNLRRVGRVGIKALLYFEVVTTIALALGLLVANVVEPGAGIHRRAVAAAASQAASQPTLQPTSKPTSQPTSQPASHPTSQPAPLPTSHTSFSDFLLNMVPDNIVGAFGRPDGILQVLFFSVIFGIAVSTLGPARARFTEGLDLLTQAMFRLVSVIMKFAPLGAAGAMAYTIGQFGVGALKDLALLMACVYLTMALFIFGVLWSIARLAGFSLWRYLVFIREEILLVLGTSSSESALPRLIERLELLGCSRSVVGMVVPAGYSFNLDGTSIYLSMAVLFIAQATGNHLSFVQQVEVMFILMLTSKGAAAVTGAGFVTLQATLEPIRTLPVTGLQLVVGVDRFMSEARAITNLIGNGVATIVISKWEGEFDEARYRAAIQGRIVETTPEVQADIARDLTADVLHR